MNRVSIICYNFKCSHNSKDAPEGESSYECRANEIVIGKSNTCLGPISEPNIPEAE